MSCILGDFYRNGVIRVIKISLEPFTPENIYINKFLVDVCNNPTEVLKDVNTAIIYRTILVASAFSLRHTTFDLLARITIVYD